jgi:hypothetical protein
MSSGGRGHSGGFATATYYEILGVAAVASHDEVKRAYLERKLRFKQEALAPVGSGGASSLQDDACERAQFRLLEVDLAWTTLRNPAARARYDDELASQRTLDPRRRAALPSEAMGERSHRDAGAPAWGAPAAPDAPIAVTVLPVGDQSWADDGTAMLGVGGRSASIWESRTRSEAMRGQGVDLDGAAELAPASTAPPEPAPRWVRWAPIIIGAILVSIVLVWGALAAQKADPSIKIDTTQQLGIGRCIRFVEDATQGVAVSDATGARFAQGVGCDEQNNGRIVARVPFPTACPQGRPEVLANENVSVCVIAR